MLKYSDEELALVMELSNEAFFVEDVEGNVLDCNSAACKMYGYKKEELIGLNIRDIVPKNADYLREKYTKSDINEEDFIFRYGLKKDGTVFPIMVNSKIFVVKNIERLIAFVRDITVEESLKEELYYQSNYDFLTGLRNRRHIFRLLDSLEEATCISIIDIDDFKKINDKYGHFTGDEVLKVLGKVLDSFDVFKAGRLGGEEFFIIHNTPDLKTAKDELMQVQKAFHNNTTMYGGITFSAGVALWKPGTTIEEILRVADKNLYISKNHGKNIVTI